MKDFRVVVREDWSRDGYKNIWILKDSLGSGGKRFVVRPLSDFILEELEEGVLSPKPTMSIPGALAQAFVDGLIGEGIVPDREAKTAGLLEATKYHLEDLRNLLKLKNPTNLKS